jgi:hypothetical protein
VTADVNENDELLLNPERQHNSVCVVDTDGMESFKLTSQRMKTQMKLKRILLEIMEHAIHLTSELRVFSQESPEFSFKPRSCIEPERHSRKPNSSAN